MPMENEHVFRSPIGQIRIVYDDKGITEVKFVKEKDNESCEKNTSINMADENLKLAIAWLTAYFKDPCKTKAMKCPNLATDSHLEKEFMCKVWDVLKDGVGPGETISYGELAKLCGNPKAARAVGQAMRSNPFTILVPCHRVLPSTGQLGNYGAGVEKKRWLLNHEGKNF